MVQATVPMAVRMAALLLASSLSPVGCVDESETATPIAASSAATQSPPSVEQVAERPERFLGKRLILAGEVDEVFSDRAFELEDNDIIFDDELLVVTRTPVGLAGRTVQDEDLVIVEGTIRAFVATELERDLSWDLEPELELRWRNKLAFLADSVSLVGAAARWREGGPDEGTLVGLISLYFAPDPSALRGQAISLNSVRVQRKTGTGLWVGENEQNKVLVVPKQGQPLPEISKGELARVAGTVREMPDAQEAIRRFQLDLAAKDYIEQQVLYVEASSIEKVES